MNLELSHGPERLSLEHLERRLSRGRIAILTVFAVVGRGFLIKRGV